MKAYIFALAITGACPTLIQADALPGYVQVQVDNINLQLSQLKARRDKLSRQLQIAQPKSLEQRQFQAELDQVNGQIDMLEKQVQALQNR